MDLESGKPRIPEGPRTRYRKGAADLCRTFMETEGWKRLFAIARGEPQTLFVRNRWTGKPEKIILTPSFDEQLKASQLVAAYGYGRPAELADPDTGRTVTDLLLEALSGRDSGPVPGKGAE